jgi:MscS family membrane protein
VPLLAGLGIGGLAVALATRETLTDVFGSLMILADRP